MLGNPSAGSRLYLRKMQKKIAKKSRKIRHICMHACMLGNPSARAEVSCTRRKNAEKITKKSTYMHVCMHAGQSLSWEPVIPEAKCRKNIQKLVKNKTYIHACMHAGESLS